MSVDYHVAKKINPKPFKGRSQENEMLQKTNTKYLLQVSSLFGALFLSYLPKHVTQFYNFWGLILMHTDPKSEADLVSTVCLSVCHFEDENTRDSLARRLGTSNCEALFSSVGLCF